MEINLAGIRQEYTKGGLKESELPDNPLLLFNRWLQEAIDAKVAAGERLPGNETLTNSTLEASYLIIERLNKLLTDVQRQKAQCIKQLAELRSMSGGGKSELVDDWVEGIPAAEEVEDGAA